MCNECGALLKAIDAYLDNADKDLEKRLKREGFILPELTVRFINEFEEMITQALLDETALFLSAAKSAESFKEPDGEPPVDNSTVVYLDVAKAKKNEIDSNINLKKFAKYIWPNVKYDDTTAESIANAFVFNMKKYFPQLAEGYLQQTDRELYLNTISQKTTAWVNSWGAELGNLMKLTSHQQIQDILVDGLNEGIGIPVFCQRIQESGIRNPYWRARRVAVTEVLRAHNVSAQEAYSQSPAVTKKRWRHTGSYRNTPRPNHEDMDGQIVDADKPFTLMGIKGGLHYPMFPIDPCLPPEEAINCHCISQPIVDENIMGLSLEEREELQAQAVASLDDQWKAELEAKAKQKAEDYYKYGQYGLTPPGKAAQAPTVPQLAFPQYVPKAPKVTDTPDKERRKVGGDIFPTEPQNDKITDISQVKDFEEFKAYAAQKLNVTVSDEIGKLDLAAVKESVTGIEKVLNEFPTIKQYFKQLGVTDKAVMSTGLDGVIKFNSALYDDYAKIARIVEAQVDNGIYPKNSTVESNGMHEAGHLLEWALIKKQGFKYEWQERLAWKNSTVAKNIILKAVKTVKIKNKGKKLKNKYLRKQVSIYATENYSETFSECISDYFVNGGNCELLTTEVINILRSGFI